MGPWGWGFPPHVSAVPREVLAEGPKPRGTTASSEVAGFVINTQAVLDGPRGDQDSA